MNDEVGPLVEVTLPGGRRVEGRLHARQQQTDGRWLYRVCVAVPAEAVTPVAGEDYQRVPTERAHRQVLEALRHDRPDHRALLLHTGEDCWAARGRLTPASPEQARAFIREGWATACDACRPAGRAPGQGRVAPT
ncbi:DUF6233 domain-containing protein [Streptomyces sp. NPDC059142]|uniref:DUF6233 domain-containing protein n=1 Tax=Streptomyces sp. NPDC059142 TaxID=3346739 RepID=UPI0036AB388E